MKNKIVYIDYASKGNSGLYTFNFLKTCSDSLHIKAYLHSDFQYDLKGVAVVKLFSMFEKLLPNAFLKNIYKCVDLYFCFMLVYIKSVFEARDRDVCFFIQFHQSFHAYFWIIRKLSKLGKIYVTVHDAIELDHNYPQFIMCDRDSILAFADVLIVHNKQSVKELNYLEIPLLELPFPLMLSDVCLDFDRHNLGADKVKLLFIGHMRKEKGIETLIEVWRRLPVHVREIAELTIAGSPAMNTTLDFSLMESSVIKIGYISDDEFTRLILDCHYVVMPYVGGTNSGVLSVATALRRPCITSNIPVFTESRFYETKLSFNDLLGFQELLLEVIMNHHSQYEIYLERLESRIRNYNSEFESKVTNLFETL